MTTIKEKLAKDFPGTYTVLPEAIYDRLMKLCTRYPLPLKERLELITYISNLPDDEMESTIAEFEGAADQEARENVPLG